MPLPQRKWKDIYKEHRQRIKNAKPAIDDKAPEVHTAKLFRLGKLKDDSNVFRETTRANIELMITMNGILRTHGAFRTFTQKNSFRPPRNSRLRVMCLRLREIQEKNRLLGKRIAKAKPTQNTRDDECKHFFQRKRRRFSDFEMPTEILSKYKKLTIPADLRMQRKLLRPELYIHLEVRNTRPLGRLHFQLFTEACPSVVLEFVTTSLTPEETERMAIIRIFPKLWMEGQIKLRDKSLADKPIEYDMRALDHNKSAGILSFSKSYLNGFYTGYLNFTISFKPLNVANGRRVAFGIIKEGYKLLECIQQYGTKNGKPVRDIHVTSVGLA